MMTRTRGRFWMRAAVLAAAVVVVVDAAPVARAAAVSADDLFARDVVHDVWIHINSGDWRRLREGFDQNTYYTSDIEWRGMRLFNAGIRSRGNGSRNGVKPGFQLDFGRYIAGQEFLGLKGLVLDNHWQDPSMIKESVSMRLFERMGWPAPRTAHVRLFVGSRREFAGVYSLVEPIDERFLQRHFGESTGHLYEYTWTDAYRFEDLGGDLDPYALRFEPRNHHRDSMFALFAPIRDMVRAINDAAPRDLEVAMSPYLDLDAFV